MAIDHGLTDDEYEEILDRLGRTPTFTELGIYSVMWSEHCSYKNSIALLKTLPNEGEHLLAEVGEENAGLVDLGDGMAGAFKIESHNHSSAVEPYEGAATGVGGIHRDIFTMGARPICALDSLRFGSLEKSRGRSLFDGVVRGIGDYGNSFGAPPDECECDGTARYGERLRLRTGALIDYRKERCTCSSDMLFRCMLSGSKGRNASTGDN